MTRRTGYRQYRRSGPRRRRELRRRTPIGIYLGLTLICFLVAVVLCFVMGGGPQRFCATIQQKIAGAFKEEVEQAKEELKQELSAEEVEGLKRRYEEQVE